MAANRRSYVGRVVSAKMQNTLVVAVDRVRHHAVYGKALRRKTVLYVHDPLGESQYGDLVRVTECRPVSKTKRFRLQAVLQRHEILRPEEVAEAEAVMAEAIETPELVAAVAVTEDAAESESDVEETVAAMDEAVDESVDEAAEEQEAAAEELEARSRKLLRNRQQLKRLGRRSPKLPRNRQQLKRLRPRSRKLTEEPGGSWKRLRRRSRKLPRNRQQLKRLRRRSRKLTEEPAAAGRGRGPGRRSLRRAGGIARV